MRYAKYKPTNIPWLPEVPEGWEVIKVGYCFDENGSGTTPTSGSVDYYDGEINWVQSGDLHGDNICSTKKTITDKALQDYSLKIFQPPFVCMAMYGASIANVSVVRVPACTNQACCVLAKNRKTTDLNYLYRCLSSAVVRQALLLKAQGGTQPNINRGDILSTRIPLPPLAEQRAIAAFLDEKCGKIDRWVAAKEREVALLKELKQAMIAEAVTGATNVSRTDTARKMKPSGIPWLPEIPEGWEVRRVKGLFSLRRESYSPNEQLQVLSLIKDVGVIPYEEKGQLGNKSKEDISGYNVARKGDIVMNSMNVIIGSVDITPFDGYISPAYYALTARQGVEARYFNYLFHLTLVQKMMRSLAKGILEIRLRISVTSLLGMAFPVPPLVEQRAIVAYIEARAAKIDAAVAGLEREVAAMKEYKQRLIAEVVTGQRRVV